MYIYVCEHTDERAMSLIGVSRVAHTRTILVAHT